VEKRFIEQNMIIVQPGVVNLKNRAFSFHLRFLSIPFGIISGCG
jgi:hypothetical protein